MIRVLHVVTYMGRGGLETMLMNYYRAIDREKVQFDFLVHRDFRADYDDEIELLGGRIYRIPTLNPFSLNYRKALNRFFAEHKEYKIVHVHQDCMSSVILKAAKKNCVPIRVAHSHSASQTKNLKYLIKLYYRQQIPQYATHLMACSEEAGKWMFGKADYEILSNAINAQAYRYDVAVRKEVRNSLGIPGNQLLIGHVGNFSEPKNHSFLIDVFYQIQKKADAKLLLIGGKNLKLDSVSIMDNMKQKVFDLGLADKVIFAGTRPDVNKLLQAVDVFVFPSKYEGLPVATIEAQATGLICLFSDRVPIECKITNLVHQISLEKGAEFWAERIIELSNYSRRDTYQEIVQSGFDIQKNATRLQEFYLKVEAEN